MNSNNAALFSYSIAFIGILSIVVFTCLNMTPRYVHYRFFTKQKFTTFTIANVLVVAPISLRHYGYLHSHTQMLDASQTFGVAIYIVSAVYNIYCTTFFMGLAGTIFQFILFWALFLPLFLFAGLKLSFNFVLAFMNVFFLDDIDTDYWSKRTEEELNEIVDEQLQRKKEMYDGSDRDY